jgi:hypothetical protein
LGTPLLGAALATIVDGETAVALFRPGKESKASPEKK